MSPLCTPNKWILEDVPEGDYIGKIGIRHNTAGFKVDM
jgi:hypothetical protein